MQDDNYDYINNEKVEIHTCDSDDDCRRWSIESLENPDRYIIGYLNRTDAINAFKIKLTNREPVIYSYMIKQVTVNYPGDITFQIKVEGETVEEVLDLTFEGCNYGSPRLNPEFQDLKVRSLSVNDFVQVDKRWFQCASCGWTEVTDEYVEEVEKLVVNHPRYKDDGGWSALNDVMWEKQKALRAEKPFDIESIELNITI